MTGANGAITLAQNYDPYGVITTTAGTSQSGYGFTGEQMDVNGLTYLRARYYDAQNGRFLSRDTWRGNVNRPLSLNRWAYVEENPVNLVDPSGLNPKSLIFYFTGFGNPGNEKFDLSDVGSSEQEFVNELASKTNSRPIALYPYGPGNMPYSNIPLIKWDMSVILAANGFQNISGPKADDVEASLGIKRKCGTEIDDEDISLTFISYSGGGQIAYSTAQSLKNTLTVDHFIAIGSPYFANSGNGNIDEIWEFWGEFDYTANPLNPLNPFDEYDFSWQDILGGTTYRETNMRLLNQLSGLYSGNSTKCILKNNSNLNGKDQFYMHGSYWMTAKNTDGGLECKGAHTYNENAQPGLSRRSRLLNFLASQVGIGQ